MTKMKTLVAERDWKELEAINSKLEPLGWTLDDVYSSRNHAYNMYDLLRKDGARTDAVLDLVRAFSDENPNVDDILLAACVRYDRLNPMQEMVSNKDPNNLCTSWKYRNLYVTVIGTFNGRGTILEVKDGCGSLLMKDVFNKTNERTLETQVQNRIDYYIDEAIAFDNKVRASRHLFLLTEGTESYFSKLMREQDEK